MSTASAARPIRRRRRPGRRWSARWRLLAFTTAPLALAAAAIVPAKAAGHGTPVRSGFRAVRLPGPAAATTVTLITGARVTLRPTGGGHYTVTTAPAPGTAAGPGAAIAITAHTTSTGLASLEAVPESVRPLIYAGQVDPGLFDVRYLFSHGDAGPSGRIPVGIQLAGHPGAAALGRMGRLPGAVLLAVRPGSGQAELDVAADRATAFWAALTGQRDGQAASGVVPRLADGVTRIWLAGHETGGSPAGQANAAAGASAGPLYTVSETTTRSEGAIEGSCFGAVGGKILATIMCPVKGYLYGLAGAGTGQEYPASSLSCPRLRSAKPYPVCLAWRVTYRVPAGVYFAGGGITDVLSTDNPDHALETSGVMLDIPQVTVAGPTTLNVDANHLVPVSASIPRPGADFGDPDTYAASRLLPSGNGGVQDEAEQLVGNWQALPTPPGEQATIGSFNFAPAIALGRPPVTAFVVSPGHLRLSPVYPLDSAAEANSGDAVQRFSGRHIFPLASAGTGTRADFRHVDARGKLVMIQLLPNTVTQVLPWQLANAAHAGAAGVLMWADPNGEAGSPAVPSLGIHGPLPYAEIDGQQAAALTRLLARGAVRVAVDDSGRTPYFYYLSFSMQTGVPRSLHYTLTSRQLAEVTASYHNASPAPMSLAADDYNQPVEAFMTDSTGVFYGPGTVREYYGPVSPDAVWQPELTVEGGPFSALRDTVFGRPAATSVNWGETPAVPGALIQEPAVNQTQPGEFLVSCAGCRQGNTFYPTFALVNGAEPEAAGRYGGFGPGSIRLYNQAGQAMPPTLFEGVVDVYKLPAATGRYKLVTRSGGTSTTWGFTSAAPTGGTHPPGTPGATVCLGSYVQSPAATAPCAAQPLLFLGYNAYTSLTNTLTAPGRHWLQVTGYHQAAGGPPVTSLKLWISTDGGSSWQALHPSGHGGVYRAPYRLPALAQTDGYLSIRAQATDRAGDYISQTILKAVSLAGPSR
jgi:hypothetical protein